MVAQMDRASVLLAESSYQAISPTILNFEVADELL